MKLRTLLTCAVVMVAAGAMASGPMRLWMTKAASAAAPSTNDAAFATTIVASQSEANGGMVATLTINKSGLNQTTNLPIAKHDTDLGAMWLNAGGVVQNQWVLYNLQATAKVSRLLIFPYNQSGVQFRGIKRADVDFSLDSNTWTRVVTNATWPVSASDSTCTGFWQIATGSAKWIKILPKEQYQGITNTGYVGLSEVVVYTNAP